MTNEILLIVTLLLEYGAVLLWFFLFGANGLTAFTVFATIAANIEVLLLVDAFHMEMTLGNILFATTFLVTDILSEVSGKEAAKQAVKAGVAVNIMFILVSQSWLLYIPSENDWAADAVRTLFANTPRTMIASLVVYAIVQRFDVWLYHFWWNLTEKRTGNRRAFLWLRNNGSTLVSQLLNSILFNFLAFGGMYRLPTLLSIAWSGYVVFIATSLLDTPFIYLARRMAERTAKA